MKAAGCVKQSAEHLLERAQDRLWTKRLDATDSEARICAEWAADIVYRCVQVLRAEAALRLCAQVEEYKP